MTRLFPNQSPSTDDRANAPDDIGNIHSRIADGCLIGLSIAAIPALAASLYRVVDIGWQPIMYLHIALAALIVASALARKQMPYALRAGILVGAFMALGIAGVAAFGLAGNGRFFFLGAIVLSVMFFGIAIGAICLLICISALTGTYTLMNSGFIVFDFNVDALLISFSAWITSINSLILLSAGIGSPCPFFFGNSISH